MKLFILFILACLGFVFQGCSKNESGVASASQEEIVSKLNDLNQFKLQDVGRSFESHASGLPEENMFGVSGFWISDPEFRKFEIFIQFRKENDIWGIEAIGLKDENAISGEEKTNILRVF